MTFGRHFQTALKIAMGFRRHGGATVLLVVLVLLAGSVGGFTAEPGESPGTVRFEAVHVFLDCGNDKLAAYQLSLRGTTGAVKIVGIEGGEPVAFRQPPFYDPKAIQQERVILAAFSLKADAALPTGRIRVATVHLQVTGDAPLQFETQLQAAGRHDGHPISPTISIEPVTP